MMTVKETTSSRHLARLPVGLALLEAGFGSSLASVSVGRFSLNAAMTLFVVVATAFAVIHFRLTSGTAVRLALPVLLLGALNAAMFLPYGINVDGLQQFLVFVGTGGLMVCAGSWAQSEPAEFAACTTRWACWSGMALLALGILDFVSPLEIFGRPGALAAVVLVAILTATVRRSNLIVAAGLSVMTILSLSRMAGAIAIILILLNTIGRGRHLPARLRLPAAVALASAVSVVVLARQRVSERFFSGDTSLSILGVRVNASGRTKVWRATMDGIREQPLSGHGPGTSRTLAESIVPGLGHPHQDYLRIGYEFGLPGLLLLVWWFGQTALLSVRRIRIRSSVVSDLARASLGALIVLLLSGLTDNSIVYSFVMFPAGVAFAGLCVPRTPEPRE